MSDLVLGIDVGTQGTRVFVVDAAGHIAAEASKPFFQYPGASHAGYSEQEPEEWWRSVTSCLLKVTSNIGGDFKAIAVDSTSGTIVTIDSSGQPLRPAIMYNDSRASAESSLANRLGADHNAKLGYLFNASFGLPKILWIREHEPDVFRCGRFIHAADFIVGRLTGKYGLTDSSNALKTGYDLIENRWPEFILNEVGEDRLPAVLEPGEQLGVVSDKCAKETGLDKGTPVIAGVSDGTAGFVASGAAEVGDWNSTLGTTLVMRGISKNLLFDPLGRFYCHKHPDGWWLPGGASNVGGECLAKLFAGDDLDSLAEQAEGMLPTGVLVYPLVRTGERMPFVDSDAEGFMLGDAESKTTLFAAYLEGVAFVERWILETAADLGADTSGCVFTTGGGAKSELWMKIRSGVLKRRVCRPEAAECAVGAAVVAASRTLYRNLTESGRNMVKIELSVETDDALAGRYEDLYARFRSECRVRFGC